MNLLKKFYNQGFKWHIKTKFEDLDDEIKNDIEKSIDFRLYKFNHSCNQLEKKIVKYFKNLFR